MFFCVYTSFLCKPASVYLLRVIKNDRIPLRLNEDEIDILQISICRWKTLSGLLSSDCNDCSCQHIQQTVSSSTPNPSQRQVDRTAKLTDPGTKVGSE